MHLSNVARLLQAMYLYWQSPKQRPKRSNTSFLKAAFGPLFLFSP